MSRKNGFTLVELVVVVLILGILAAVAVPKIINNGDDAADSGVAQTLTSIRDAIELYRTKANAGGYPNGNATEVRDKLLPSLRGSVFPKVKVGGLNSNVIKISATLAVDTGTPTSTTPGWVYDPATGEIIINSNAVNNASIKYSEL
jgi:prepilin-type N-terminal cleavage/methylation domain-containing protein